MVCSFLKARQQELQKYSVAFMEVASGDKLYELNRERVGDLLSKSLIV